MGSKGGGFLEVCPKILPTYHPAYATITYFDLLSRVLVLLVILLLACFVIYPPCQKEALDLEYIYQSCKSLKITESNA